MVDTLAALVSNTESTPVGIPQNRREGSTPDDIPKILAGREYPRWLPEILARRSRHIALLADAKIFLEPVQLWRVQGSGPNSSDG